MTPPIVVVPRHPHPQMRKTSLRGKVPITVIISCHCPPVRPPPPDFHRRLPPLLIVKCPPLGSILVSVNSNAVGKDVGGGIVLEIVIGVPLPIRDDLRCHTQEFAPPTSIDDVGSFAPPPRWRSCGLRPSCHLCRCRRRGQRQGASNAAAAAATVIVVVLRPQGRRMKDDNIQKYPRNYMRRMDIS
jgi:hypothetical protein